MEYWYTGNGIPKMPMNPTARDFFIALGVISLFLIGYVIVAGIVGLPKGLRAPCRQGERAMRVDGSEPRLGKNGELAIPDADFPICAPILSCPTEGPKWAVQPDGSALTNQCAVDSPNCQCSIFQHCPAYASTLFRQFGSDERLSFFQIVDPLVTSDSKPEDPYDPPYLLQVESKDSCYLNANTIQMVWPALKLGDKCIRGTLGKIKTSPSLFVCAPTQYVELVGGEYIFDVDTYKTAYESK